MKPTLATLAVLVLFAVPSCTGSTSTPVRSWKLDLPSSKDLSGNKIDESRDGPWVVRAAQRGGGPAGYRAEGLRRDGSAAPHPAARALAEAPAGAIDGPSESLDALALSKSDASPPPATSGGEGGGALRDPAGLAGGAAPAPAEPALGADSGAPASSPMATPSPPAALPAAAAMRAGSTDDNEEFEKYLEFLASWSDRKDVAGQMDDLDVAERKFVRVVNAAGKPVPGARVLVVDENADAIIASGTTYGDGRVPVYPHVPAGEKAGGAVAISFSKDRSLIVEVAAGGSRRMARWDGAGPELTVTVDAQEPVRDPVSLDVVFLIDTTGSLSDEIERIKATLLQVTRRLRSIEREFDLRYGAVLYRDLGDEYVTRLHPFTSDIEAFDGALRSVVATGGGDEPESLNQGLAEAVGRMDWRDGAAKVVFLIADAPPHMDYQGDVRYGESLKAAVDRGIRIHAVAASGLNPLGTLIFRQIAQYTRGKFIFIEYGSPAESAASHGVAGATKSNNLDDIIYEQIRDEVAGWGRA